MKISAINIILSIVIFLYTGCKENDSTRPSNNPIISSISPYSSKIGDTIEINGKNFGIKKETNDLVLFGNVVAREFIEWNNDLISVIVPSGATTCKIKIIKNGQMSNEYDFILSESLFNLTINCNRVNTRFEVFIDNVHEGYIYNENRSGCNTDGSFTIGFDTPKKVFAKIIEEESKYSWSDTIEINKSCVEIVVGVPKYPVYNLRIEYQGSVFEYPIVIGIYYYLLEYNDWRYIGSHSVYILDYYPIDDIEYDKPYKLEIDWVDTNGKRGSRTLSLKEGFGKNILTIP